MTHFNDQESRIAAYLDGQMSAADLASFEADLEQDPALAEAVARFGANDGLLRAAFEPPMQEPVDDALLTRMGLGSADVVNLVDRRPSKPSVAANDDARRWARWRWPAAGAIAAALVVTVMTQTGQAPTTEQQFAQAMETLASGQSVALASGEAITPVLTFKAGDGRYCREFSRSGATAATGIACRGGSGWVIEAEAKGANQSKSGNQIATADGADSGKLDEAYARLKASDPVDGDTEKALIAVSWRNSEK